MGGRLIRALIVIYGARKIGAAEYGAFSYALSLAAVFGILADLGLDAAMIKEASAHPEKSHQYFSTALAVKIFLIISTVLLVIVAGPSFSNLESANILLPIVITILVLDTLREFGFAINRSHQKMEKEALVNIITNIGIVVFGVWLITISGTAWNLAIGYALGTAIGSFVGFYVIRQYVFGIFKDFRLSLALDLIKIGWPLAFAGILGTLMINTDTLLLGLWKTELEIGFYSAAQRPVSTLYGLLGILAAVTFPIVANLVKTDKERLRALLSKTIHFSFLVAAPLVVGGLIVAEPLMIFLFGSSYASAALIFQILLLSLFANFATVTLTNVLVAYSRQRWVLVLSVVGLIGNAILDIVFIPIWSGAGSAFSTFLIQTLVAILLWRESTLLIGYSDRKSVV